MQLGLVVDLDRPTGLPDKAAVLRDAVQESFLQRVAHFGGGGSCFA
jgi:hypothetical protein